MTKEELLKLDGRELYEKCCIAIREGKLTERKAGKIYRYWLNHKNKVKQTELWKSANKIF